jgi:hypothetical protein
MRCDPDNRNGGLLGFAFAVKGQVFDIGLSSVGVQFPQWGGTQRLWVRGCILLLLEFIPNPDTNEATSKPLAGNTIKKDRIKAINAMLGNRVQEWQFCSDVAVCIVVESSLCRLRLTLQLCNMFSTRVSTCLLLLLCSYLRTWGESACCWTLSCVCGFCFSALRICSVWSQVMWLWLCMYSSSLGA